MSAPFQHPNPGGARPVDRIDEALAALGDYWRANPDQRLTQVVLNAVSVLGVDKANAYNVEDAALTAALRSRAPRSQP